MGCIATIGTFDGVHKGHMEILRTLVAEARRRSLRSLVVTFATHPLATIRPDKAPRMLTTAAERSRLILAAGVDSVEVVDFPAVRNMSAADFMAMLRRDFDVEALVVGYDHRFGHDGPHTFDDYRRLGAAAGIDVIACGELRADGAAALSSSSVRASIAAGDMAAARRFLGRDYSITGTVAPGLQIGRTIGFPTANIAPDDPAVLIPRSGVYAARVRFADAPGAAPVPAVVNIGCRPTLGDGLRQTIEAHLIDFDSDLYGRRLTVDFVARLRDERRFPSLDALRAQLVADRAEALKILS